MTPVPTPALLSFIYVVHRVNVKLDLLRLILVIYLITNDNSVQGP